MVDSTKTIIGVGVACFIFMILAAVGTMIGPTLQGVGTQTAGAMGTNNTAFYNATQTAATNAATGYGASNQILPFMAIAFGLMLVLGINLKGYFGMGGGRTTHHRYYGRY